MNEQQGLFMNIRDESANIRKIRKTGRISLIKYGLRRRRRRRDYQGEEVTHPRTRTSAYQSKGGRFLLWKEEKQCTHKLI
jgi:hypothetical protein